MIAVLVAAGLTGGAAYALLEATDDGNAVGTAVALPTPSLSQAPVATPTPEVTPTPDATVAPTGAPSPTATPTATPSARATASPTPRTSTAAAKTYPYPRPTDKRGGMYLSSTIDPGNGTTETVFGVSAKASDGDGTLYFAGLDWGDGTKVPSDPNPQKCKSYPSPTSPPPPYKAQPDTYERTPANAFRHTYAKPGNYTVVIRVSSVNADCRPYGPSAETLTVTFNNVLVTQPAP